MNNQDILERLKSELTSRKQMKQVKIGDLKTLINGYRRSNYKEVYTTKLYKDEGGIYCYLLEVLHHIHNSQAM